MKKIKFWSVIFFLVIMIVTGFSMQQSNAQTASCPVGFKCTPLQCPAGYKCTAVNQRSDCPDGYICEEISPNPSASQIVNTDANISIATSSLNLIYSSNREESLVEAVFTIKVVTHNKWLSVYTRFWGAGLENQNKIVYNYNSLRADDLTLLYASTSIALNQDNSGFSMYTIPPNQTVYFKARATVDPRNLFAGTYSAVISNLLLNNGGDSKYSFGTQLGWNRSNTRVIIGETSPYISGIYPDKLTPGQTISISGQRFYDNRARVDVLIDDFPMVNGFSSYADGRTIVYKLPPDMKEGYHTLQIQNSLTGKSNRVALQVLISTTTPWFSTTTQVMGSTTPTGNGSQKCYVFTKNLNIGSTGVDVVALQNWLINNGYNIPQITQAGIAKGIYGSATAAAVTRLQKAILVNETAGYFGPLTRSYVNSRCGSVTGGIGNATTTNSGIIVMSIDPNSPLKSAWQISSTNFTDLVLAIYDMKSQGGNSTLKTLTITPHTSGASVQQIFADFKIRISGNTYSATSISSAGVVFGNLNVPLSANVTYPFTILGKINPSTSYNNFSGASASTSLRAINTNPYVVNDLGNQLVILPTELRSNDTTFIATTSNTYQPNITQKEAVCPAGYICRAPTTPYYCPEGYTCNSVSYSCPTGYVCSTYVKNGPAPTVSPYVTLTPTPTPSPTYTPVYYSTPAPSPVYSPSPSPSPVYYPSYTPMPSPSLMPTASLTANGSHNISLNVGSTVQYSWNSSNASLYSSTFSSNNPALCGSGNWIANTASGSSNTYISSIYAGCSWTVTYTARNNAGQIVSDTIYVKVNPTSSSSSSPTPSPVSYVSEDDLTASIWDAVKSYFDGLGI